MPETLKSAPSRSRVLPGSPLLCDLLITEFFLWPRPPAFCPCAIRSSASSLYFPWSATAATAAIARTDALACQRSRFFVRTWTTDDLHRARNGRAGDVEVLAELVASASNLG